MRYITLSVVKSRKQSTVRRVTLPWNDFVDKLREPVEGSQMLDEYLKLDKEAQVDVKDVGGYVGGTFTGNRRKRNDLKGRDILTFDLDNLTPSGLKTAKNKIQHMGVTAVIHSTRKHTKEAPRIRLIILLDRTVTGEEYEFLARAVAHEIGMEAFDPTTFQPARLMFMPSVCKGAEYLFEQFDGKPLDTPKTFLSVPNWKDTSKWHYHPSEVKTSAFGAKKQQNPLEKEGAVGAFCRTYSIYDVLDEFIPGKYISTNDPDRFTYIGATTTGGAVVYDDGLFIYSNHTTDPASGMLLNAFDLVRTHRFGELDKKVSAGTAVNKLPSYAKMCEFAAADERVKKELLKERFKGESEPAEGLKALSLKKDGMPKATINNVFLILQHDKGLNNPIVYDEFADKTLVVKETPWSGEVGREWTDADQTELYHYIETKYCIANRRAVDDAVVVAARRNSHNPITSYLNTLSWDGRKRVATLFIDYLGAEDNNYTRSIATKLLTAAVQRAYEGGNKFDYMPILVGEQGIGKSTLLDILGGEWYTDALTTFDGKKGAELIAGKWVVEVGELAAMGRHEIEEIKQFITRRQDRYRAAYGRRAEDKKRRCILVGTSNETNFLRDTTGNRRFLPIQCMLNKPKRSVWKDLVKERDQLWAEAVALCRAGAPVHLSKEEEEVAESIRSNYLAVAPYAGIIEEYISQTKYIPTDWYDMDVHKRKLWLSGMRDDNEKLVKREYISAIEIWVECLNGDIKKYSKKDANAITLTLKQLCDSKTLRRLKPYGHQWMWRIKE